MTRHTVPEAHVLRYSQRSLALLLLSVTKVLVQQLCGEPPAPWHQEHFNAQKPKKTAAQLARQQAALLANIPEDQRGQLNANILSAATGLGMVCT